MTGQANGNGAGPIVGAYGVVKNFGHVRALRHASFEAFPGQVTALVGDNGAGKSTLIKILAGVLAPDEGEVRIDGTAVHLADPHDAKRRGIETVYQDLALAPDLDAAANVFLGREVRRLLFLHNHPEMRRRTAVDRKSTRLNSSHVRISYAVFC